MSHVRACPFQEIGLGGWSVLAQLRLTGTFEAIRYRQVKTYFGKCRSWHFDVELSHDSCIRYWFQTNFDMNGHILY
jgi:hypothetical protein